MIDLYLIDLMITILTNQYTWIGLFSGLITGYVAGTTERL